MELTEISLTAAVGALDGAVGGGRGCRHGAGRGRHAGAVGPACCG
jgi:hypothetical protein